MPVSARDACVVLLHPTLHWAPYAHPVTVNSSSVSVSAPQFWHKPTGELCEHGHVEDLQQVCMAGPAGGWRVKHTGASGLV